MTRYELVERPAPGIARLVEPRYGYQVWTRVTLRKPTACRECDRPLATGEKAFSPLTNGQNRSHRLCVPCIDVLSHSGVGKKT